MSSPKEGIAARFRSFLPVIIDVETAGFNPRRDALLEVAYVIIAMDEQYQLQLKESKTYHIEPFPGANLDESALKFNGIDPFHPFRLAREESEVMQEIFSAINQEVKSTSCTRAILVGHNPTFDLSFVQAAAKRVKIKKVPFHSFSTFDTATLGGLAYGQTVLSKACRAAGIGWHADSAHSALYDAEQTARLFCTIVNQWPLPTQPAKVNSPLHQN
ncbi:ribonuclease T [Ectothiorhodospiraceae bacterium BW-2]|nr:ribonuclease T [Ectothiorhodospiraceae bacterium BW-2]